MIPHPSVGRIFRDFHRVLRFLEFSTFCPLTSTNLARISPKSRPNLALISPNLTWDSISSQSGSRSRSYLSNHLAEISHTFRKISHYFPKISHHLSPKISHHLSKMSHYLSKNKPSFTENEPTLSRKISHTFKKPDKIVTA